MVSGGGLTWNFCVSFRIAAKCTVGTAGGMGMRISDGKRRRCTLEISDIACLCISASVVGDGLGILYRFYELWSGRVSTGCLEKAGRAGENRSGVLWPVLAGLATVLAITWKITAIIPLIAGAMIALWKRAKINRRVAGQFVAAVVVFGVGINLWANTYELTEKAAVTANPVISWVALGMKEDGSWTNNTELVEQMYQFSTKEEKQQYCVEYIRENKADFFNVEHLRKRQAIILQTAIWVPVLF